MGTKDPRFCKKAFESIDNLLARSTLLSVSGEKERKKLFQRIKERIAALRA